MKGALILTLGWAGPIHGSLLYLILNLAIGGGRGGQKGIDVSSFPQRYWAGAAMRFRHSSINHSAVQDNSDSPRMIS